MTAFYRFAALACIVLALSCSASAQEPITIGANVNMVSGDAFPNGDPFQRQQNEPSVAFSSRNSLHLLAGANDYRAVDVPGVPGGAETGDSWPSYFWSTNGGATWKSTLIPGYPQDPDCQTSAPPELCGYAAGADPVVRAGANGMFYYSGIVFERSDPSRSAIFVARFIDLNNDEGGDPIRYIDTKIVQANNDGTEFLDKSWIGVDIPRGTITDTFSVVQRDDTTVEQTVACGNLYVGYGAISGEGSDLRSEVRLATSTDCGNTWAIQTVSEPNGLSQGANIAIDPVDGDVHVVWRRFESVDTFLGATPTGCPAGPLRWKYHNDWPLDDLDVGGINYSMMEARDLLGYRRWFDETYRVANVLIAAKLNLLTGGGDPRPGFNAVTWAQELSAAINEADAWLVDNPIGSRPKGSVRWQGKRLKINLWKNLFGSGKCSDSGGVLTETLVDQTNAIMVATSIDFGETFSAPAVVSESTTFDQGSTTYSFRTTAWPTATVDADGRVYVAWAARGFAAMNSDPVEGDARVVISTSPGGAGWSPPYPIDEPNRQGHQIKPSILFAGGQLTLVYYDFRQDVSNVFEPFVVDLPVENRLRHTVDVRIATALPAPSPVFTDYSLLSGTEPAKPSSQASRYLFVATGSEAGVETVQAEYMVPNFPMFADGSTPFIGDYVDVAAPNLVFEGGAWRFAFNPGEVQVWQAVWSDNRNVIPPPDGDWTKYVAPIVTAQPSTFDPTVTIPSCLDVTFPDALPEFQAGSLYTGTRNQNVYSASISSGLIVAAPGNNRPLIDEFGTPLVDTLGAPLERGFVVFVQNTTPVARSFRVSLPAIPAGIQASLEPDTSITQQDIEVSPYSSAVVTVFVKLTSGAGTESIPVSVAEIGGTLAGATFLNGDPEAPGPLDTTLLSGEIHNPALLNPALLNPALLNATVGMMESMECTADPSVCLLTSNVFNPALLNPALLNLALFNPALLNPALLNPALLNESIFNPALLNAAVYNPALLNPALLNPALLNPALLNPALLNPALLNPALLNQAVLNPALLNPALLNPAVLNPALLNPALLNPALLNPALLNSTPNPGDAPQQVDLTFAVTNDGTATTAYNLDLAAEELEGLDYELIAYRLNETPFADGCFLTSEAQQQLIFSQSDPLGTAGDGTFYLEPGEEIFITLSVKTDPESENPAAPETIFEEDDVGGTVTAQKPNNDPNLDPPAEPFGATGNLVPATAGGTEVSGGGGTAPIVAATLTAGEQISIAADGFATLGDPASFPQSTPNGLGVCPGTCLVPGAPAIGLVARIAGGPWQFIGEGPTILTANSAGDLELAVNDNIYSDNTGAYSVAISPVTSGDTVFTETAITNDFGILNDGTFVVANDLGAFPSAVTVNGVPFGTSQAGLNGAWGPGSGDFSVDPFSANLDALLSDLQFTSALDPVSLTIPGLTPGNEYRLQLLFSNDLNTTGDRVQVTIQDTTYILDDWQPGAVNLTASFIASDTSVEVTFNPAAGSTAESGRAVVNAYALHEAPFADTDITNVVLSSSTLTIEGTSVSYTATIVNNTASPLSTIVLQTFIQQPGVSRASGGLQAFCGAGTGVLPPGTCDLDFSLNANNTTSAGSGTLTAGPATAVFELRLNGTTFDTFTVPITLADPSTITITSVTPAVGSPGENFDGFIVIRGTNFPLDSAPGTAALFSNGGPNQEGFIFLSPSTTNKFYVRLPDFFPLGPATVQIQDGSDLSNAFPITVSLTPGTPIITEVYDYSTFVPTTTASPGSEIAIAAEGIDTTGWEVRFVQGSTTVSLTPDPTNNFAVSSAAIGLAAKVVVPSGFTSGSVEVSIRQGPSAFSAPVILQVPIP